MQITRALNAFLNTLGTIRLRLLAVLYVAGFLAVEELVPDVIRHYNFCVLLALSGIFFAWLIGGKRTMYYVAFFNCFLVFVFSSILWNKGIIVHSGLFVARAFTTIYVLAMVLGSIMLLRKSPADERSEQQQKAIEEARQQRQNLEFMVASNKLKQDLLGQANAVKDELLILEGAWRSKIHDIINDLPDTKERELYGQIIAPFQEKIITHLRELATSLTFDLAREPLSAVFSFLQEKITAYAAAAHATITLTDAGWEQCSTLILIDRNKLWEMLVNIIRNSQAAIDLKRIELLRSGTAVSLIPQIKISTACEQGAARITVFDNGGGVPQDQVQLLYREPVPSAKRGGKATGQGTVFVKFFAERMGISVRAENTTCLGSPGLAVMIIIPLLNS